MIRFAGITVCGLLMLLMVSAAAEIVRVVAPETTIYDPETRKGKRVQIQDKRFMVYDLQQNWYLVRMKIGGEWQYRWLPVADVQVDFGKAKTKTARVELVYEPNRLKLDDGNWVQFAGVLVPMEETPLKRQTEQWLKQSLEGQSVTIEYDNRVPKLRGYVQVYVYVNGQFVNRTLVQQGLARVPPGYKGRYLEVFGELARYAKDQGLGIYAGIGSTGTSGSEEGRTEPPQVETPQIGDNRPRVRQLTQAEQAQWARNLGTTITPHTKREKTSEERGEEESKSYETIRQTKTLEITVRNGWGFALQGLDLRWELFGRRAGDIVLQNSGQITGINLAGGASQVVTTDPVVFELSETEDGDIGARYYGYRVTFTYEGATVKVVATPGLEGR